MSDLTQKDGGPAFPGETAKLFVPMGDGSIQTEMVPTPGMSLRDYFAAHAFTGVCTTPGGAAGDFDRVAAGCYRVADAMLAARAKEEV